MELFYEEKICSSNVRISIKYVNSRAKNQTESRRQNRMETTVSRQQVRNRTENHRRVMDREDLEVHLADSHRALKATMQ